MKKHTQLMCPNCPVSRDIIVHAQFHRNLSPFTSYFFEFFHTMKMKGYD